MEFEMNKSEAYIECHYFESGFKSKFLGKERPDYLPSAESVGLHNEVILRGDDYSLEVVRFNAERKITWIGYFISSQDKDYGDRGNYCGVGVWLVNYLPIHISALIDSLAALTSLLHNGGLSTQFETAAQFDFRDNHLVNYLVPCDWVPKEMQGLSYSSDQYYKSKYFHLKNRDQLSTKILADSIRYNLLNKQKFENNRSLYFIGNTSKITANDVTELSPIIDLAGSEACLLTLLSLNADKNMNDNSLAIKLDKLSNENERLFVEVSRLNEVVATAKSANDILTGELTNVRTAFANLQSQSNKYDNKKPDSKSVNLFEKPAASNGKGCIVGDVSYKQELILTELKMISSKLGVNNENNHLPSRNILAKHKSFLIYSTISIIIASLIVITSWAVVSFLDK